MVQAIFQRCKLAEMTDSTAAQRSLSALVFNVAPRSQTESLLHYLSRRFLSHENYFGFRGKFAKLLTGLDSIQFRNPMSSNTKSGCSSPALRTASSPSDASPMTSNSGFSPSFEQMNGETVRSLPLREPGPLRRPERRQCKER